MLYMNFAPTDQNHWAAFSKSLQVAEVTLKDGKCSAAVTPKRALSQDEMESISLFMRAIESGE